MMICTLITFFLSPFPSLALPIFPFTPCSLLLPLCFFPGLAPFSVSVECWYTSHQTLPFPSLAISPFSGQYLCCFFMTLPQSHVHWTLKFAVLFLFLLLLLPTKNTYSLWIIWSFHCQIVQVFSFFLQNTYYLWMIGLFHCHNVSVQMLTSWEDWQVFLLLLF